MCTTGREDSRPVSLFGGVVAAGACLDGSRASEYRDCIEYLQVSTSNLVASDNDHRVTRNERGTCRATASMMWCCGRGVHRLWTINGCALQRIRDEIDVCGTLDHGQGLILGWGTDTHGGAWCMPRSARPHGPCCPRSLIHQPVPFLSSFPLLSIVRVVRGLCSSSVSGPVCTPSWS